MTGGRRCAAPVSACHFGPRTVYSALEITLILLVAAVLGVVAYLLALFAYTIAPVSYSGAIREMSVMIGAFLGWQFLGEQMGGTRVAGAIIIFAGILTIALFG